jgi:hypothetical protein
MWNNVLLPGGKALSIAANCFVRHTLHGGSYPHLVI